MTNNKLLYFKCVLILPINSKSGEILEFDNRSSFPGEGKSGIIYIAKDTNKKYI